MGFLLQAREGASAILTPTPGGCSSFRKLAARDTWCCAMLHAMCPKASPLFHPSDGDLDDKARSEQDASENDGLERRIVCHTPKG